MVNHIILWKIKEQLTCEEKEEAMLKAKTELEALVSKIEGIVKINVHINPLSSSNADMLLDSAFIDEASLKAYSIHPEHIKVAQNFVIPIVESRTCFDFKD